jgi:hypothetical protein
VRVGVRDPYYDVTTAVGYLSASDKRLLVGLGSAAEASLVEIRWPSGSCRRCADVKVRPDRRWPWSPSDDHAPRAAGAPGRGSAPSAFGPGRLLARRAAPAARQALGPALPVALTDVADKAGLTQPIVYGGLDSKSYIIEVVGCGVAFFDYDNDGWLDLLVLNGTRLEGAPPGTSNRLYKNNRDGTFTDVTEKAGLRRVGWASGRHGRRTTTTTATTTSSSPTTATTCCIATTANGTFTDVTAKAGSGQGAVRYASGCTWLDYDRDGRLDLFVAYYLDTTLEKLPKPGENTDCRWKGVPVNCGPRGLPPGFVQLFHNNGDGTFTDVSKRSWVAAAAGSYPMTAVAADYDDDGWPDIYVACDSTPSFLFRNQRDGTFRQEGLERGVAVSEDGGRAGGDGHRARGLRSRRDGGPLQDPLLRRHQRALPQRRQGLLRRFHHSLRARGGDPLRRLGNGDRRPRQRRLARPVPGHGKRLPRGGTPAPAYPYRTPRLVFRNLGDGRFEELIEEAGPAWPRPMPAGLRVRRFRQRRRPRRPHHEHERASFPAPQRRLRARATG